MTGIIFIKNYENDDTDTDTDTRFIVKATDPYTRRELGFTSFLIGKAILQMF